MEQAIPNFASKLVALCKTNNRVDCGMSPCVTRFLLFVMRCFKNIIITFGLECLRIFISSVINWFELLWYLRCADLILETAISVDSLRAILLWWNPLWVSIPHPPSPIDLRNFYFNREEIIWKSELRFGLYPLIIDFSSYGYNYEKSFLLKKYLESVSF